MAAGGWKHLSGRLSHPNRVGSGDTRGQGRLIADGTQMDHDKEISLHSATSLLEYEITNTLTMSGN